MIPEELISAHRQHIDMMVELIKAVAVEWTQHPPFLITINIYYIGIGGIGGIYKD